MEAAAAGEKLRLVANFSFFFRGDISTDFHRDSTNSLPAHIDASPPPPASSLVFAARKIGRTVANDYIRLPRPPPRPPKTLFSWTFEQSAKTNQR